MVLTLSLSMIPWACTMKKYVLADGTKEKRQEFQGLREAGCIEQGQ